MSNWKALALLSIGMGLLCSRALGQPTPEQLLAEIERLRTELQAQKEDFENRITALQSEVDSGLEARIRGRIDEIVADKSKFYRRPEGRVRQFGDSSVFDALEGGLIFSGLFRSRFEYRANNVDFNASDERGLDDEGVRMNGRFRLGFGAVLLNGGATEPSIAALMEFQSVGTFAGNTYFTFPGPAGVPLPTEFTIFREPYEQVSLYQGYIDFHQLFADDLYVRVGRQEMVFGSELQLGNNTFYDGTAHDGILVEFERADEFRISAFYAKEAQSDSELAVIFPASDFDEDQFMGLHIHVEPAETIDVEGYALYFDARSNFTDSFVTRSTNFGFDGAYNPALQGHFWTLGARVFIESIDLFGGLLSLNAEAAYQTGDANIEASPTNGNLTNQGIHGWQTEFIANYWFDPNNEEGVRPILTLAYYYAQGGEVNHDTANGFPLSHLGFQPLFVNRHFNVRDRYRYFQPYMAGGGRYGNMDMIPLSNMHIIKAGLSIAPSAETEVGFVGLMAITADNEGWGTGIFGYELDLYGSYQWNSYIQFSANFSVFFPEKTAEQMSNYLFFSGFEGQADNEPALAFYIQALIEF